MSNAAYHALRPHRFAPPAAGDRAWAHAEAREGLTRTRTPSHELAPALVYRTPESPRFFDVQRLLYPLVGRPGRGDARRKDLINHGAEAGRAL